MYVLPAPQPVLSGLSPSSPSTGLMHRLVKKVAKTAIKTEHEKTLLYILEPLLSLYSQIVDFI